MKRSLVLAALAATSLTCAAQSDDAARGLQMWSDTPGVSGVNTITGSCSNCHTVQNRRTAIGGSAFADISFDTAMTRLVNALQTQGAMQTFQQLPLQDVRDLATYIADTPKTTTTALDFTATAVNTPTAAQTVDLRHSVAPVGNASLSITSVTVTGTNASAFAVSSNSCTSLAANGQCRIGVTFSAPDTAGKTATLNIALQQGSQNFSRTVALSGAVAGGSQPPATGSSDGGGGSLGIGWLAALAVAVYSLRRRLTIAALVSSSS